MTSPASASAVPGVTTTWDEAIRGPSSSRMSGRQAPIALMCAPGAGRAPSRAPSRAQDRCPSFAVLNYTLTVATGM